MGVPKREFAKHRWKPMGARLINNPRRTNRGYVDAFPVLQMRSLRKAALFKEGHQTVGFFQHPSISGVIPISVDLCVEHDLKVIAAVPCAICLIK
jgi:hypothetical protein